MIKILNYDEFINLDDPCKMTDNSDISGAVREIIDNVQANGDKALYEYTEKFDGVKLNSLIVSEQEIYDAFMHTDPEFVKILEKAAANIKEFHEKQKRESYCIKYENGTYKGNRIIPIEKAGIYVPGGTAAYPSTVLMDCIPAKIAGCKEVIMVTPPGKDGKINHAILVAAGIAGVDKIFKVGGAQAIAALSFGTETVPRVYKIVGPGNAFVAEAKRQVFGLVSIDMIAGPSEIMVIADSNNSPEVIAADLLSQAEHDKRSSAVLVTFDRDFASLVAEAIEAELKTLEREDIARASIDDNGKIIIAENMDQAVEIANTMAPEHLELCIEDFEDYLEKIVNAGSVFLGRYCPEALGDYMAGCNHTLPTSGTARFSSPLSVDDFIKKSQYIYYTEDEYRKIANDVYEFALKEGLTAHAKSAVIRLDK